MEFVSYYPFGLSFCLFIYFVVVQIVEQNGHFDVAPLTVQQNGHFDASPLTVQQNGHFNVAPAMEGIPDYSSFTSLDIGESLCG